MAISMLRRSETYALVLMLMGIVSGCAGDTRADGSNRYWVARRSPNNPLLTASSSGIVAEHGFSNINGPSVIRVPSWIDDPLGRYYMYFAHHRGSFIRLAYANSIEGPWTVATDSVLRLEDTHALDHVASPDVHVDHENRVILMYFHSVDDTTRWVQTTYAAHSADGLKFDAHAAPIGPPYMRVFRIEKTWWAIAKVRGGPGGMLMRARSPFGPFHLGPKILPGMRHAAVLVEGDIAHVFFSRIGDAPERVVSTGFNPEIRWIEQSDPEPNELLHPLFEYEGAKLPVAPSEAGEAMGPVNALRDPFVFSEDGRHYLFYAVAGESGIAVARLSAAKNDQQN